jgi:uncharacterized membrane-anchored protein YhcB (DUF1043 family)
MGLWEMVTIVAVAGIIAGVIQHVYKPTSVKKQELREIQESILKLQADIDEIKVDLSTVVIQLDDLKAKL